MVDPITEEKIEATKELIELENHLADNIQSAKSEELKERIREVQEEVRELRMMLEPVKHGNAFHCPTKHVLSAEKHFEEIWAREKPKSTVTEEALSKVTSIREKILELAKTDKTETGICPRCEADLSNRLFAFLNVESFKNKYDNNSTDRHYNIKTNGDMMEIKDVGMIAAGQAVGRVYATFVNPEIDKMGGEIAGQKASTLVDIVLGVGLPAIALYVKMPEEAKLVLASMGTQRLVDGVSKIVLPKAALSPVTQISYTPATVQAPVMAPVYEERYPFQFAR
jgi:hypothetical protein